MGRGKGWRVGIWVAAGLSCPAWGAKTQARLQVSARVVQGARVEAPLRVAERSTSRQVPGGTEWWVEVAAPAALELIGGCSGVRLGEGDRRGLWVFVPQGSRCTPVLRATVLPDAAPGRPFRN